MEKHGRVSFTVRMLGGFSVTCEGREIHLSRKSTAKFVQMLQIIWMWGEDGITKEQLVKCLYDRKELSDSNNSINNLLYQLRKQMVAVGLPQGDYITGRGGIYQMDPDIPVRLDVHEFEKQIQEAQKSKDEEKKCRHYRNAFELYRGELLPALANEIWVMEEHLRLKVMFEQCMQWLVEYYDARKDYNSIGYLYDRAAAIYPFDYWQIGQIDVLLAKGDYAEANLLYNKTVAFYLEEMGQPPSEVMKECYQRICERSNNRQGELENIKGEICRYPGANVETSGTYYCSYPSFVDICHVISRNTDRLGKTSYLMLCTLTDYEGKMILNTEKLRARMDELKEALQTCLRRGDVFTQYSTFQYLVMLIGSKEEECENIYKRICHSLKGIADRRAKLEYVVVSLEDLHPEIKWE
ncbi:MAG: BTAD domain-containing putative transcriptional regulator [Brotaphodocola sp.]